MSEENIVSEPLPVGPERNYRPDRFIHEITLRNILSFGPDTPPLKLGNLNVLIGPNGSGKSNLIETVGLLQAMPTGVVDAMDQGGAMGDWVWKGGLSPTASLSALVSVNKGGALLRHAVTIGDDHFHMHIKTEEIARLDAGDTVLYSGDHLMGRILVDGNMKPTPLSGTEYRSSVVERRRDPDTYPEITALSGRYRDIRVYADWVFGRRNTVRAAQAVKLRGDRLEEDFSNLIPFLNRKFGKRPAAKRKLVEALGLLYNGLTGYELITESDNLQLYFTEGDASIRSKRLSDGSLRFLCLAAILLDPEPPALICIEEPELGLHPDVVGKVAQLMREASQRTQLIVTTHSSTLIDHLTDMPEAVVVFGKEKGATTMERLQPGKLQVWLKQYNDSLGALWTSGEIGGNRW